MFNFEEVISDLKEHHYDFRINDLDEGLEVRIDGVWQRFNDTHEAVLKTTMREVGYGTQKKCGMGALRDAYTAYAHSNRYNPIKDYFEGLRGEYQPKPGIGLIEQMVKDHFTNPDGMFSTWLHRWMVGTIAKIYEGERNPMLVLVAGQGIGKSYFCGWLCPLSDKFFKSPIEPDKKDSKLRLIDVLIWEVEELGATTRRADVEALKHFITLPFIYERFPYGRYPLHKPATASFIGTVNHDGAGFLNDPTGSTRFLSCEITSIDFEYTNRYKPDDLWAEAVYFYHEGQREWELSASEKATQNRINAKYEQDNPLEDVILEIFEITNDKRHFISTVEIRQACEHKYKISNEKLFQGELSRTLTRLGLEKGRAAYSTGHQRGWFGLRLHGQGSPADNM